MQYYALSGFDAFRCMAAACPDSCCVGWDVVIDDESASRYRAMDTQLGRKLRGCMRVDEDGDTVFESVGGRCPFWQADHLCEIQRLCGEAALSVTCARFPRIVQEYDDFTERCLSLSCPEAARLTLSAHRLTAPEPQSADPFLQALVALRTRMIALVQDRTVPFAKALCRCLWYAQQMQAQLDEAGCVCADVPIAPLYPAAVCGDASALFRFHGTLDLMTDTFRSLTQKACGSRKENRTLLENLAVYYLYRYVLQAVQDGDILAKVQLMLSAVSFTAFADAAMPDTARLYSKEIEHSYENMEQLYEAFWQHTAFAPEAFYSLWGYSPDKTGSKCTP